MTETFEEQLAAKKQEAKTGFEQQLKAGYRGYAEEHLRQTGRYPEPRVVEEWRRGRREQFEASLSEWEATQRTQYATESEKAKADWRADILRQYPSDQYKIEWASEGATITERPKPMTAKEQIAMLQKWKEEELYLEYPPERYQISFLKQTEAEGWKAIIEVRPEVALAEWKTETIKQYPPEKYFIEWTGEGAKIYEKLAPVPLFVERGMTKAQQAEMKQYGQMVREVVYVPSSVERGFYKAQQAEAKYLQEQMQTPAYEPKKVSLFYAEEKGKRQGVEVAPIEAARAYAYYHPEKIWKAPYLYKGVRAFGEWLETEHAKTASGMIGMPSGARGVYLVSGFVKGAESLVRPEIRTAGSLLLMEPLGLITGRPLGEAAGTYGETIKGYEPELLGELVFDYLFGAYVLGPLVGKAASGIKRGATWAGEKVASYVTETQAYQYILEPAWRTGKEAFMTYGLEPAWRGVKAYGVEPALRGIKTYVYEPLIYGVTTYGYEPLRRGAEAWTFTYGLEPMKRGLTTYAYEPMKQAFVTYALPPIKETQIYIKSVLTPYIKEQIEKYGIEPIKRGLSQYVIEPAKYEFRAMISPLPDWYRELKYGIQLRAWTFHPTVTEAYRGIRPTLGIVDLPYLGLKGPKPISPHVTGKTMMLFTETATEEAAKAVTQSVLPEIAWAFTGTTVAKAPTILHAWKGEPYPFIKVSEAKKETLKPYPLEKFEFEPYPKALETLYPYQIEKWREPQKQKPKIISKLMPSPDQIQRELQEATQVSLSKTKTALIETPAMAQVPGLALMEQQTVNQAQRLKQVQRQILSPDYPPELFELSKAKRRRKRGKPEYPFGRYKRFYPVMGGRQALKELMGI